MVATDEAPICSLCEQPKARLRQLTALHKEPVWVCAKKASKQKMPCDGWLFNIAAHNDLWSFPDPDDG